MKGWQQSVKDAIIPGLIAGATTSLTAAARGRADSGSAIAPINATSHVFWGDRAAAVREPTLRHTLTGYLINSGAAVFWAAVLEKLFGETVERRGLPLALLGGASVAGLAYVTDYHLVPRRLTPGYEKRVSGRSLFVIYGVLALSLGAGALLVRKRGD